MKWTKLKITKLTEEDIDNLKIYKYIKEIEFVVLKLHTKKLLDPDSFTVEFYHVTKK